MFVIRAASPDPLGPWDYLGPVEELSGCWAIDGTVLEWNRQRYFIWSGWEGRINVQQDLYIAPMADPLRLAGPRVLIFTPEHPWERAGGPPWINEGPQVLRHGPHLHLIYSANGS